MKRPARPYIPAALLAVLLSLAACPSLAEHPMVVDDAGTMERGGAKLEFGMMKDVDAVGFEAAAAYAPLDDLELELAFGRARSDGTASVETIRAVGAAIKWAPLQSELGLSAGLKYGFGHQRVSGAPFSHAHALSALLSWRFAGGSAVHGNLGRKWSSTAGNGDAVNLWGAGVEFPLRERLYATLEAFGIEHEGMGRQFGLRYALADGVKISGAVGHGAHRSLANVGIACEF